MNLKNNLRISFLLLVVSNFASILLKVSADESQTENANKLIQESKDFKLRAHQFHLGAHKLQVEADRLNLIAKNLTNKSEQLKGNVKENTIKAGLQKLDVGLYQAHLKEFKTHANLYNVHLRDYERQLLKAQLNEGVLSTNCRNYADHVSKFHVPGIRPPHVCIQLKWEEADMQKAARNYLQDQKRSHEAERQLAQQESKLMDATRERLDLEKKLLKKASSLDLERAEGVLLLKEYDALEKEYKLIELEKKRLNLVKK